MPVSTGSDVLDRVLDGGLPAGKTILLTGGPGTGKRPFAMQFRQQGLDDESGMRVQRPSQSDGPGWSG